jgi:hypothetical protein
MENLGQLYEAHHEHTNAPVLVLVPGADECGQPEGHWKVRVTAQVQPSLVAPEVGPSVVRAEQDLPKGLVLSPAYLGPGGQVVAMQERAPPRAELRE